MINLQTHNQYQKYRSGSEIGVSQITGNCNLTPLSLSYKNSGFRPRFVDAELDPGGRGKELVGKGLDTRAKSHLREYLNFTQILKRGSILSEKYL